MKFFQYIILFVLVFLLSCKQEEKKFDLTKDWFIIQPGFNDNDSSGYENMALSLNEDGTYTHFAVHFYNYGKWEWRERDSKIVLNPSSGYPLNGTFIFELADYKPEQLQVKRIIKKGNTTIRKKNVDVWFGNKNTTKFNPFIADFNTWRIKPASSETKEQIRKRTLDYLNFLKVYFSYLVDNKIENLTHGWYPQPFQLHFANTARMAYSNELNDWNKCFFNEEQAIEGYKIFSGVIYKVKLHHKESVAERNLDMVNQLLEVIE
jgi:hypothetical protein